MGKEQWLQTAEIVDAFRVVPRLVLFAYLIFVFWLTDRIIDWYFALPAAERSMEASGLAVGLFTAITGFGTVFVNMYIKTGREWNGHK